MGGGQSTNTGSKAITEHDRAVADLKSQMAKLDRYQKQMNNKNKQEEVAIKKLLRDGRRDRAMSLLKLKKMRETQVDRCQQTYYKLEELVMNIESAQINQEVLKGLAIGNESLKKLNEIMSIEAVEALMDETDENIEQQREIDALFAGSAAQQLGDELEEELALLLAEEDPTGAKNTAKEQTGQKIPLISDPSPKEPVPSISSAEALEQLEAPTHKPQPKVLEEPENEEEDLYDQLEALSAPSAPTRVFSKVDEPLAE